MLLGCFCELDDCKWSIGCTGSLAFREKSSSSIICFLSNAFAEQIYTGILPELEADTPEIAMAVLGRRPKI